MGSLSGGGDLLVSEDTHGPGSANRRVKTQTQEPSSNFRCPRTENRDPCCIADLCPLPWTLALLAKSMEHQPGHKLTVYLSRVSESLSACPFDESSTLHFLGPRLLFFWTWPSGQATDLLWFLVNRLSAHRRMRRVNAKGLKQSREFEWPVMIAAEGSCRTSVSG